MKQVLQNIRTGETSLADVPRPLRATPGRVLIRTERSLVSAGTERMLVEFGRAGWIEKARQQPDKVRMVLDKIGSDGLLPTAEAVLRKLDEPIAMGYCNAGVVVDVGDGVNDLAVGDRVASNGQHAHYVLVPSNLCARIPKNVNFESASFTVLGAVALQGVRLANPTIGECVTVMGLGMLGLITVQVLRAGGCRVLGMDFDPSRLELARRFGAETVKLGENQNPVDAAMAFSRGTGVDAVIITTATNSNDPVRHAAIMSRKRGRIVLVGVSGLELSRNDFYQKELTFQVSCSYGPGRYDPSYEEKGIDYPIGHVRWTERRNFQAILDLLSSGRLDVTPLISHRYSIEEAANAYHFLAKGSPSLGIVFRYGETDGKVEEVLGGTSVRVRKSASGKTPVIGFLGAGGHASSVLMPEFRRSGARLKSVSSLLGVSGTQAATRFGIEESTTDSASLASDPEIDVIVVGTRHSSHAQWVCSALESGKSVFVEKPLATSLQQLGEIDAAYHGPSRGSALLMVGFNRRFAPQVRRISSLLRAVKSTKAFVMTINAGAIPDSHWTQDPTVGGGRIVGEACHFIDLLRFLADCPITNHSARALRDASSVSAVPDTVVISLAFEDGSIGTINYLSNGHRSLSKERLEIFCSGRVLVLDNYRRLRGYGWPGFAKLDLWRQDKGHRACVAQFIDAIRSGGSPPIAYADLMEVSRVTLEVHDSLVRGT